MLPSLLHTRKRSLHISFISIFMLLALLLTACGSNSGTTTGGGTTSNTTPTTKASITAPNDLITPGTLTIGSDTTYPPQEFIDTTSKKATGFDVDLITEMAARMRLKANVVTTDFDTIIDSLVAKRFDVVISALTINPERQKKVDFVPYFNAGSSLLVQKGNPKNLKSVNDLCGLTVGVQKGTVEQTALEDANKKQCSTKKIELTILQDQTAVVQLLANNRVVATYQDSPVTDYYIKQNPGRFDVGGSVIDAAPEGIAVRKNDSSMMTAIQTAFNSIKSDGTYRKIVDKWGVTSGALSLGDRRNSYA